MEGHDHHHHDAHGADAPRRALVIALSANAVFLVVELAGGVLFNSLALFADAAHMVSDVAALSIALLARRLSTRAATERHTYGLQRAEVLGAQANAVLLFAACAWISFEAVHRLQHASVVRGGGLLVVGTGGLIVNVVSAVILARASDDTLNMRGAILHMTLDAAGSVAAIVAGIAIVVSGAEWVDPAASLVIVVLVLYGAWGLLRDATHVLMEGTPRGLDVKEIETFIAADPVVEDVHHVHVWNLASNMPALSAHVVIAGERSLHEAQQEGDRIRAAVLNRYGIEHTTFELECHACED